MSIDISIQRLMVRIGYTFQDSGLLKTALSHRSMGRKNNERLEFLGDAIVNFVITDELYRRFPEASEGELSRLRASLVKGENLAELARQFELGATLHLGAGELKSGGDKRTSILADAFEAIIGAIYLEAGISICQQRILAWFASQLDELCLSKNHKDPKSELQEKLQALRLPLPEYKLISIEGEEHEQYFIVECVVELLKKPIQGRGKTRKQAEQQAARHALQEIAKW